MIGHISELKRVPMPWSKELSRFMVWLISRFVVVIGIQNLYFLFCGS